MSQKAKNDLRHYAGAAGIFILIIFLLLFLSFNEIPPVNKDIFVTIVGMLTGSLGVVVYTLIGRNPDEVAELSKKNESLVTANENLIRQKDELENMVINLQETIIDKISLLAEKKIDG